MKNKHIVQQQILDITLTDRQAVSDIQDVVSDLYHKEVIQLLDEVFSEFCGVEEIIQIEELTVDLGKINVKNFKQDFVQSIKTKLEDQLTELVYHARNNNQPKGVKLIRAEKEDPFIAYLKNGRFPWWVSAEDRNLNQLIESFSEKRKNENFSPKQILGFLRDSNFRKRLIDTLPVDHLSDILSTIDASKTQLIFKFQKDIIVLFDHLPLSKGEKNYCSFYALDRLIDFFFTQKVQSKEVQSKFVIGFFKDLFSKRRFSNENNLLQLEQIPFSLLKTIRKEDLESAINKISKPQIAQTSDEEKFSDEAASRSPLNSDKGLDESIEITHVGVILFWPFLQIFFKEMGLIENQKFKDEFSCWKAIHLLHYLVTGEQEAEEHELLIHKILCNVALSEFVPMSFELTDLEKEECDHLVQTVIDQWSILKKSSIEGFRNSFLKRDGILQMNGRDYMIQVERKSFDIILEKLSWGISNIKHPWNNYLIQVEW